MIAAGIVLLSVSVSVTSSVLAKYIHTVQNETTVTTKAFYFESDYLTENHYEYKLHSGTEHVSFHLYNYQNELRVSEIDSKYTVSVESEDSSFTLTIDGEAKTETTVRAQTQKDVEVVLGSLKSGNQYTVTVTADGGYQKVLSATFTVDPVQDGFFMNVDETDPNYLLLTVWTENVSGNVSITVPAGLIPDTMDPVLKEALEEILEQSPIYQENSYQEFTVQDTQSFADAKGYASHAYRFFKTNDYDHTKSFRVKMGERSAVEARLS